jgi:hypothetical protein
MHTSVRFLTAALALAATLGIAGYGATSAAASTPKASQPDLAANGLAKAAAVSADQLGLAGSRQAGSLRLLRSSYPPTICTPAVNLPMVVRWQFVVFRISFCSTWFLITNTRTGQRWVEGFGGWFCRSAPSWAIWAVTFGRYRRC